MAEEFETKHTDDGYEDVCFICRRPESRAGKMFKMPGNMTICMDCMQKTMETVSQMDYQSMLNNPAFFGGVGLLINNFCNKDATVQDLPAPELPNIEKWLLKKSLIETFILYPS